MLMLSRRHAHSAILSPKTPISLRSSLRVSLRVCIVVRYIMMKEQVETSCMKQHYC